MGPVENEIRLNTKTLVILDDLVKGNLTSESKVLDIGTGSGFLLYRLFHKFNISYLYGNDLDAVDNILDSLIWTSAPIIEEPLFLYLDKYPRNYNSLYDIYCAYVYLELQKEPLKETDFNTTFHLNFNEAFEPEIYTKDNFDLIIGSRIFHYIDEQEQFLIDCMSLLKVNGKLYLSFPSHSRNKTDKVKFDKLIKLIPNLEVLHNEEMEKLNNDGFIVFTGTKSHI